MRKTKWEYEYIGSEHKNQFIRDQNVSTQDLT